MAQDITHAVDFNNLLLDNVGSIRQRVLRSILVSLGSSFFDRSFGSRLLSVLFSGGRDLAVKLATDSIKRSLSLFVPEVELAGLRFDIQEDQSILNMNVDFVIVSEGTRETVSAEMGV